MGNHHPPHIYLDDTWYFISASTLKHALFLVPPRAKVLLRDQLKELTVEFGIVLRAWVILDDHYHLLLKTRVGKDLSRFFGHPHGATSRHARAVTWSCGRLGGRCGDRMVLVGLHRWAHRAT